MDCAPRPRRVPGPSLIASARGPARRSGDLVIDAVVHEHEQRGGTYGLITRLDPPRGTCTYDGSTVRLAHPSYLHDIHAI